jgi:hypothetical protein
LSAPFSLFSDLIPDALVHHWLACGLLPHPQVVESAMLVACSPSVPLVSDPCGICRKWLEGLFNVNSVKDFILPAVASAVSRQVSNLKGSAKNLKSPLPVSLSASASVSQNLSNTEQFSPLPASFLFVDDPLFNTLLSNPNARSGAVIVTLEGDR